MKQRNRKAEINELPHEISSPLIKIYNENIDLKSRIDELEMELHEIKTSIEASESCLTTKCPWKK